MHAEIVAAIVAVRGAITSIKPDAENKHDNYVYVSIDSYYEKVSTVATKAGLIWRAREKSFELIDNQGARRDRMYVRATYVYDVFVGANEVLDYMTVTVFMPVVGPQTTGQLYSYADKVFMRTTFCVPTGEKDADDVASAAYPQDVTERYADPLASQPPRVINREPRSLYQTIPPAIDSPAAQYTATQQSDLTPPDFLKRPVPERFQKTPTHDADGVVYDNDLAPAYVDGLPLFDKDKVDAEACATILHIFETFMPMVKSQAKLTQWHTENVPVMEVVQKIDPNAHTKIKSLFRNRFEALQ